MFHNKPFVSGNVSIFNFSMSKAFLPVLLRFLWVFKTLIFNTTLPSCCAAVSASFHHLCLMFVVQGLGIIKAMSRVTSAAPLTHEELKIDYEAWTNSLCESQNKDPQARKRSCDKIQVVLRGKLAWTDLGNTHVQNGTLE